MTINKYKGKQENNYTGRMMVIHGMGDHCDLEDTWGSTGFGERCLLFVMLLIY